MDREKLKNISLKELYLYYNNIDKTKNPEQASVILELIRERENSTEQPVVTLARLGDRLLAIIIDGLIMAPLAIIYFLIFFSFYESDYEFWEPEPIIYNFLFAQLVYLIVNGYLLYKKGQTVGKKLRNIKIVTMDNTLPSFDHVYGLRYFLVYLIGSIPILGGIFSFIDALFIFRDDRRCLHDHIAGTKVIEV